MKFWKIIFILPFVISCTKEETKGPLIGYASDEFSVVSPLTISQNQIDFSVDSEMTFSASFNEIVNYTLTLTGINSGAKQVFTGIDEELRVNWIGNADLIFFQNEKVKVELSVLGKEGNVALNEVEIIKTYTPEGIQLANFETGKTTAGSWFPSGNQIASNVTYRAPISLEGNYSHLIEGVSVDKPGDQFIGLASIDSKRNFNRGVGRNFKVPTLNPDSLYFTVFIYGTGDKNVAVFIKFMQDDDENNSHEPDRENGFEMQITDLSHIGWKKFSFPYSSVPLGGNTNFGGNGDGIYRPDHIRTIELGLWALKDPSKSVKLIYDYAVFTANKPFGE